MPGIAFLNKKEFHTGSFKMIEKVWQAEKAQEAAEQRGREHAKRLAEERYEEELKRHQVRAGLLPAHALDRMDWMYAHQATAVPAHLAEEYLLGKPVDGAAVAALRPAEAKEAFHTAGGEDFVRRVEDPLVRLRQRQETRRPEPRPIADSLLAKAPHRLRCFDDSDGEAPPPLHKRICKADSGTQTKEILRNYVQQHLGNAAVLDERTHKLRFIRHRVPSRPGAAFVSRESQAVKPACAARVADFTAPRTNIVREMNDVIASRLGHT